jgi:hypothetical protein
MVCLVLSTENHFIEHREATVRQHGLRAHGRALGWASEEANAADGNAAQSATTTQARKGFRQLTQGVACRRLGGVSPLTVLRSGRSSADSHQLLDLCDVVKVLFVSEPVIHSSCDDNGYLLPVALTEATPTIRNLLGV